MKNVTQATKLTQVFLIHFELVDASPRRRGIKTLPPSRNSNSGGSSAAETAIDLSGDSSSSSTASGGGSSSSLDKGWKGNSDFGLEKSDFLSFNDSLTEDEALRRAVAISLEESVSSSAASEEAGAGGEDGGALSRMTEEEQLRKGRLKCNVRQTIWIL